MVIINVTFLCELDFFFLLNQKQREASGDSLTFQLDWHQKLPSFFTTLLLKFYYKRENCTRRGGQIKTHRKNIIQKSKKQSKRPKKNGN